MQVTFSAQTLPLLVEQMVAFLGDVRGTSAPTAPAKDAGTAAPPPTANGTPVGPTVDDVRAKFSAMIQAGQAERAKKILRDLGASNLSTLSPDKYAQALQLADDSLQ